LRFRSALCLVLPLLLLAPRAGGQTPAPALRPRVALVLSGGSALGLAHAGVIEVIESAGIPIDLVLGTSMGSIVGGLYAAGYSPQEMQDIVRGLDWNTIFSERRDNPGDRYDITRDQRFPLRFGIGAGQARSGIVSGGGLLSGQNVITFFTGLTLGVLSERDFDRLPVPYRAVAADILSGEKVVFSGGSMPEAMRASMSIPGVFKPWSSGGHLLVDGGIVDNMPVDIARAMGADIVIAVESRSQGARDAASLHSGFSVTAQTVDLYIEENMKPSRAAADLLIKPDLKGFSMASYAEAAALVDRGRAAALAALPELEALARRIAASRALVTPETEPNRAARRPPPLLSGLDLRGGSPEDRAFAAPFFDTLVGRQLSREALVAAIDRTYVSGRFELVTFELVPEEGGRGGSRGLVTLLPDLRAHDSVYFGGFYRGVLSGLSSTESGLSPALYIDGLGGRDSALFIEFGLLGRTLAAIEWFQPLGPLYLKPELHWEANYDSRPIGEGLGIRSYFRRAGGELAAGLNLGRRGEAELRYGFEWVVANEATTASAVFVDEGSMGDSSLGRLEAKIDWADFDQDPFPSRGFGFAIDGRFADPALGGDTAFTALDLGLEAALPLAARTSLAISFFAGSDFSGFLPVKGSLPPARWYGLRHPGIFHELEARPERGLGNHVGALGLELRSRLGRLNALVGGDVFGLVNLSVGAVRVTGDPSSDFLPLRWDGSLGLGLRMGRGFGALLSAGLVVDGNRFESWRPGLCLELGMLRESERDRR